MQVTVDEKILRIERHILLDMEDGEHSFTANCVCSMNYLDKFERKFYHQYSEQWVHEKVYVHNPFGKYEDTKYITRTFGDNGILDNVTLEKI